MVLGLLLAGPALALTWYAGDAEEAARVAAALNEVWPDHSLAVIVGPPLPQDPEGAVWWDGGALTLAQGEERRRAEGLSDPSLQVAMVRGWLAREVRPVEAPPLVLDEVPPPTVEIAPAQEPSPLLLAVSAGPYLALPAPRAGWRLSGMIGGQRGRLFMATLITLSLGERAAVEGDVYALSTLDAEFAPGLRLGLGENAQLWLFATGGTRATLAWERQAQALSATSAEERAFARDTAFVFGPGVQLLVDTDTASLGGRLRVVSSAPSRIEALQVGETSLPLLPGVVSLELVWSPRRAP